MYALYKQKKTKVERLNQLSSFNGMMFFKKELLNIFFVWLNVDGNFLTMFLKGIKINIKMSKLKLYFYLNNSNNRKYFYYAMTLLNP